mgnify:CR=1 FL=1
MQNLIKSIKDKITRLKYYRDTSNHKIGFLSHNQYKFEMEAEVLRKTHLDELLNELREILAELEKLQQNVKT